MCLETGCTVINVKDALTGVSRCTLMSLVIGIVVGDAMYEIEKLM